MINVNIKMTTVLYFLALSLFEGALIFPLLFAILLHEMGHVLCARILKVKITRLSISPLGGKLELKGWIPYKDEFLISLAGPFGGICGFLFSLPLVGQHRFFFHFAFISICLSIFNLLPLPSLDGGRILKCLSHTIFSFEKAELISNFLSFFALFLLWTISVYLMIKLSGGLSSFVFCSIFFAKCFLSNAKSRDFERI